jgi:hypothetical protein
MNYMTIEKITKLHKNKALENQKSKKKTGIEHPTGVLRGLLGHKYTKGRINSNETFKKRNTKIIRGKNPRIESKETFKKTNTKILNNQQEFYVDFLALVQQSRSVTTTEKGQGTHCFGSRESAVKSLLGRFFAGIEVDIFSILHVTLTTVTFQKGSMLSSHWLCTPAHWPHHRRIVKTQSKPFGPPFRNGNQMSVEVPVEVSAS